MKEATIRFEFTEVHDRIDLLTEANNANTNANIDSLYRIRAFENLINRNWFLRKILGVRKMQIEMARIREAEGLADAARTKAHNSTIKKQQELLEKEKTGKAIEKKSDQLVKSRIRKFKKQDKSNEN